MPRGFGAGVSGLEDHVDAGERGRWPGRRTVCLIARLPFGELDDMQRDFRANACAEVF